MLDRSKLKAFPKKDAFRLGRLQKNSHKLNCKKQRLTIKISNKRGDEPPLIRISRNALPISNRIKQIKTCRDG